MRSIPDPLRPWARLAVATAAAALVSGCSMIGAWFGHLPPGATPDNAPTLKTLAKRQVVIAPDPGVTADEDKAIAAYR
ncbi:MAG TPA: hypothetical protein VH328_02895, partial [Burkholderiaceae bacterium]|nr:hypothetical protein [Burkholderiaceae bacterium]